MYIEQKCEKLISTSILYLPFLRYRNYRTFMKRIKLQFYHTLASASAEKGVSSAGLSTTVHPAAIAAQAFRVIIALGKFHWKTRIFVEIVASIFNKVNIHKIYVIPVIYTVVISSLRPVEIA